MRVSDFDFELPPDRIAQQPAPRGEARLLVVDRATRSWREGRVRDLPQLLTPGDLLVVNDSRVFPARLIGRRDPSGGAAECFLLEQLDDTHWNALVHPGQKLKPGARLTFDNPERAPGVLIQAEILERRFFGRRLVRLEAHGANTVDQAIEAIGHVPLPPYIHRGDAEHDRARYQTVFARERGSVAAPTAGLHFDEALVAAMAARGIHRAAVTLHVGYGTFKPVRAEEVEAHTVDTERYHIPVGTQAAIAAAKAAGRRVVAVGTTTTRALESAASASGEVAAGSGATDLFIHPSDAPQAAPAFRIVDALLTNFHLPRSSLLMLVCAFAGRELTLAAYEAAVGKGFRFYSYGDAMLIL